MVTVGFRHTEATRRKMSIAALSRPPRSGEKCNAWKGMEAGYGVCKY